MKQADTIFLEEDMVFEKTYKAFGYTPANTYMNRFLLLDVSPALKAYREWVIENGSYPDDETYLKVFKFIEKDDKLIYPLIMLFFDLKAPIPTYYIVEGQSKGIFDNEGDEVDMTHVIYKMVLPEGVQPSTDAFIQVTEDEMDTIMETDPELHVFHAACGGAIYSAHKMHHLMGDRVYCKVEGGEAVDDGTLLDLHIAAQYEIMAHHYKSRGIPVIPMPETKRPQMKVTFNPMTMMLSYFVDGKLIAEDADPNELLNKCARIMSDNQCSSHSAHVILQFLGDCYFALTRDMRTLN